MNNKLSHINEKGNAYMVDVSDKLDTVRVAIARGEILLSSETIMHIKNDTLKKGNVLSTAQIAGVMGSKETSRLIPMCHPLMISNVLVELELDDINNKVISTATVKTTGKTGVEMEALNSVSISLLTVYDMCKAVQKDMIINDIKLIEKTGGKSDYKFGGNQNG